MARRNTSLVSALLEIRKLSHVDLTFVATNAWWLGHLRENSEVDQALSQIAEVCLTARNPGLDIWANFYKTGYKVVRTWGFGNTNDASATTDVYYQVLNSTGQYFNFDPSNGNASIFRRPIPY